MPLPRCRCNFWRFFHVSLCLPLLLVLSPISIAVLGLYLTFFTAEDAPISFEQESYANTLPALHWGPPLNRYAHLLASKPPLEERNPWYEHWLQIMANNLTAKTTKDPLAARWDRIFFDTMPSTSSLATALPRCDVFVRTSESSGGLSEEARALLMLQFLPGDCRVIEDPSATALCSKAAQGTPMELPTCAAQKELWMACLAAAAVAQEGEAPFSTTTTTNSTRDELVARDPFTTTPSGSVVRLCEGRTLPPYVPITPHFSQRYEWGKDFTHATTSALPPHCLASTHSRTLFLTTDALHPGGPRLVAHNTASALRAIGARYVVEGRVFERYKGAWSSPPGGGFPLAQLPLVGGEVSNLLTLALGPTLDGNDASLPLNAVQPWAKKVGVRISSSPWQARIHASQAWAREGFFTGPSAVVPTGVDTQRFKPPPPPPSLLPLLPEGAGVAAAASGAETAPSNPCQALFYVKQRGEGYIVEGLEGRMRGALVGAGCTVHEFIYGQYLEEELEVALTLVHFGVVLDDDETQGMAVMEMLAAGVPLLVNECPPWRAKRGGYGAAGATNVPYWAEGVTGRRLEVVGEGGEGGDKMEWEAGIMRGGRKEGGEKRAVKRVEEQLASFMREVEQGVFHPRDFILQGYSLQWAGVAFMRVMCGGGGGEVGGGGTGIPTSTSTSTSTGANSTSTTTSMGEE